MGSLSSMRSAIDCSSAVGMFRRLAFSWVSASTCFAPFGPFFLPAMFSNLDFLGTQATDQPAECGFDLEHVGELLERPASEGAEVVDPRHPERAHGLGLELRIAAPVTLRLEHQVDRIVPAVVDLDDEVRNVF